MKPFSSPARRGALAALTGLLLTSATLAQCPVDDGITGNGDCANAAVGSLGLSTGLVVQALNEDFWSYTVPAGMKLDIDVTFTHVGVTSDIDLQLFDTASSCQTVVDSSGTVSNLERVAFDNASTSPVDVTLRVFLFGSPPPMGACTDYDIQAALSPTTSNCFGLPDDAAEDNDSCSTPLVPTSNPLPGLFCSKTDEDFWAIPTLLPGEILTVSALFSSATGDLDIELFDSTNCTTVLAQGNSGTDDEVISFNTTTGAPLDLVARVFVWAGDPSDCNDYEFTTSRIVDPCTLLPDDAFEENDDCSSAAPVTSGVYSDLFARKEGVDEDWYSISVPDGIKLTVTVTHVVADGNIDLQLFDACFGVLLDSSITSNSVESVAWINTNGFPTTVRWGVWLRGFGAEDCTDYDMQVQLSGGGPGNLVPYCFGDGSGVSCPCGNNSPPGHLGGCANSAGNGAILAATGSPSVNNDTLNFDLSNGGPNSF
ncbi:MAG: hypothetical protein AAF368_11170, partial [Planctomycetota bacterium]